MVDPSLLDEIKKAIQKAIKDAFKSGQVDGATYGKSFAGGMSDSMKEARQDVVDAFKQARADKQLLEVMEKTKLKGSLAEYARLLQTEGRLTDKAVERLQAQQRELDHIEEQNDLTRKIAATTLEIREEAEEYTKALEKTLATARAIGNDPKVFGAYMLTQMVEHLGHINHQMHELVDTGMQAGEAIKIMREDFGVMSVLGLTKVNDVSKSLVANFGTANALTSEQRDAIGEMAYSYGLAGEEATNLMMAISRMPGESKDSAINFKQTADNIGKMKGVLPSQIMKEVAKNTQLMATFSKGGVEGFAKAAAEAKRLGIELSSVGSAAEKLLDFESSITSQMEASVLIGKELNFDRMREAALAGDLNGVMEEQARIMKEVGSMDGMNTLQKKALADAMGLTTEELEKMSEAQKFNNQYFGENSTTLDNVIGKTLKYGGAVVGVVKEHGMMALTILQAITQLLTYTAIKKLSTASTVQDTAAEVSNGAAKRLNATQMQVYNAMRAQGIAASTAYTAAKNIETGSETLNTVGKQRGILATISDTAATVANTVAKKVSTAAGTAWNFVKGLSIMLWNSGFVVKVRDTAALVADTVATYVSTAAQGAWNLAKGLGNLLMNTAIGRYILLGAQQLFNIARTATQIGLNTTLATTNGTVAASSGGVAGGIRAIGRAATSGAVGLLALGATMLMIGAGIALAAVGLAQLVSSFKDLTGPQVLGAVGSIIVVMGGFVAILYTIIPAIGTLGAVGTAVAIPLLALGGAFLLMGAGIGLAALGLAQLVGSLKDVPFENLLALPLAFMGIGAGLYMMAAAGLAALPILGALTMLGVVAPALSGLGESIGGLLGGGEDDKMGELLTEIRGLRSDINRGGIINMDGQKVGEVVALALNTTGG